MAKIDHRDTDANRHLTFGQIGDLKADAEHYLISRPELRSRFDGSDAWHHLFHDTPGVYTIFIGNNVVYVGESGNLRARMRDLRETRNHTFRRSHGKAIFCERPGFIPASASRCFDDDLETELTEHMGEHVSVCTLPVWFGRKEIEEYLTEKYKPIYCRQRRRGT
jgi:hypothetical protein